ncbi:Hypothetical predicted protein [Paramuricea clavata]|uniref:HYDIN/VesB/CFA65-like Ig-like domain-containing protein n=1 Tax=Paramuricea clavata TaxID=317549 RepID=A0A6S7H6D3_PARCT|nr:Hypothetical predicted protein [Paramuricea clavata]
MVNVDEKNYESVRSFSDEFLHLEEDFLKNDAISLFCTQFEAIIVKSHCSKQEACFNLSNISPVNLDYTLDVTEDISHPSFNEHPLRTSSRASGLPQDATFPSSRPATAMGVVFETGSMSSCLLSDGLPFTVEPSQGRIPAGESVFINVRFAPSDITEYQGLLKFTIPNLHPDSSPPEIKLKGRSLLPYCHFELDESDYITGGRRNPELPGPGGAPPGTMLNPNTKVIEFQSCGVKVKVVREFYIINPTDMDLNFIWTREDPSDSGPANFTCTPKTGLIESGKKIHMRFEYISNNLDLTESFWRFFIQEHNISLPFLLVGHTTEPVVSLDRSHFNFREILIGFPAEQTVYLVNEEEKAFSFSFNEDSCYAEAHAAQLFVEPMSGSIPAKSRVPIILRFTPTAQKEVNFNVVCKVKKKTVPLTLNVKAEGFAMKVSLICEDSAGNKIELTSSGCNRIQFAEVEINERALRQLFVINSGKFNFDFTWDLQNKSKLRHKNNKPVVSIGPQKGTVSRNSRKRCMLTFCPPGKCTLQNCTLMLKITNGPTYNIEITGSGIRPSLKFSFNRFDFGPCFLYRAGIAPQRSILVITNEDSKDINVHCKYENTAFLELLSQPSVLLPGESSEIDILFYPRECKHYHEVIPFEINGLSLMSVDILGQGTEIKVDVCNPDDRKVNFGALRIGQSAERIVKLRNNSPAAITFSLVITPSLPILQQSSVLTVSPSSEITLEPNGGSCNVHVMFTPTTRIPQFTEEVMLECAGLCQTVFLVSGTCQAVDIKLDSTSVPFGAVVIGSQSSRVLVMQNLGDIGARFSWNMNEFSSDFSVEPIKGYSSPGTEVSFELKFCPQKVNQDIRNELSCMIEGSNPLKLVLTGSCVFQTPVKEVIHFSTHVRTRETRSIVLNNRSNLLWQLCPKIDGAYWSGADLITVEPLQSKNYELIYRPLVMTHEGKRHQGSVFFPLPDGNGLLYNVTGISESPKAVSNIVRDIPCKTNYTELLTVNNWLKKPQRFRVITEMIKPDKLDGSTVLKGLQYIDVPGQMKKDYKIDFYAHKEGTFSAKIIFKNEQTSEYLFYYVTFKATPPGIISTIDLTTPVRQSASHVISLYNPLTVQVNFSTASTLSDILLPPNFTVPPQSEGSFTFDYLPLKSGEVTGRLTLSSSELGFYQYDLNLTVTPAGPENQVHFRTYLGSTQNQTCRFINFCKSRVEYICKVDNPDFHVERSITAASASSGGTEVNVEVIYEPSCLGNSRATLLLTSPMGGDYTFPLYGYAAPPKPQGPYTIKAGASASIPFKNVFPQATQFTFHVDNPVFSVKPTETIRAKKVHNVVVTFDGNQGNAKTTRMGRLVVASASSASLTHNIEWVYYLKGVTP